MSCEDCQGDGSAQPRARRTPRGRRRPRNQGARRRAASLRLETLETRVVPATITVISAADDPTMVLDSLRAAIDSINHATDTNPAIAAERTGAYGSNDTIAFDLAGSGVQTIAVKSELPAIAVPLTIDGYSQPGAQANTLATGGTNAHLLIQLSGPVPAGPILNGLTIAAADCTIRGLAINGFAAGVLVFGPTSHGNVIAGNFIGTDAAGTTAGSNFTGVLLLAGATGNTVGGTTAADLNLLSSNSVGVQIDGVGISNNVVSGNRIGTDANGAATLSNSMAGVRIVAGATSNLVGGSIAGASNLIAASTTSFGVEIQGLGTDQNVVSGNTIVADFSSSPVGNFSTGVVIYGGASGNTVGGTTPGARNVINNLANGVIIQGAPTSHNVVSGNYIGTDAAGNVARPNHVGVSIVGDTTDNTIGGTTPGASNVISGNFLGVDIQGLGTTRNVVLGNVIGTDVSGLVALANQIGVSISGGAHGNTLGGSVPFTANRISSNTTYGVVIQGAGTNDNLVAGNFIIFNGLGLSNGTGVFIYGGAKNNTIGGTSYGLRNSISDNANGIVVGQDPTDSGTVGNSLLGNLIVNNTRIGIDLGNDGRTPNGVNPRAFPNHGQNDPVLIDMLAQVVRGTFDSAPNTFYRIEFYSSTPGSPAQGEYLGHIVVVKTDAHGHATFNANLGSDTPYGAMVTATATNLATHDTSEFAAPVAPIVEITPATMPAMTLGRPFSAHEVVLGASDPAFRFTISSGVLPAGLRLDLLTGLISGTPRTAGPYDFTVKASQSSGGAGVGTRTYRGVVNATGVSLMPSTLPALRVAVPLSVTESANGGSGGPYTFAVTAGALPAGLALNVKTGQISGTPATAGAYGFTLTATAAGGDSGSQRYLGNVQAAPAGSVPRVLNLQRFGFHDQRSVLVLSFTTALDPARAQDLGNYALFAVGAKGRLSPVPLASATYDPAHFRVTLTPAALRLDLHGFYLLEINGKAPTGLATPSGILLDGLGNGHPGSDYAHVFGPHALAGPNRSSPHATASSARRLGSGHVTSTTEPLSGLLPTRYGMSEK